VKITQENIKKGFFYRIGSYFFGDEGKVSIDELLSKGYLCNPFYYNITNRVSEKIASLPTKFIDSQGQEVDKGNKIISDFLSLLESSCDGGLKEFTEVNTANLIALGECAIYMKDKPVGFKTASELKVISPVSIYPNTANGASQSYIKNFTLTGVYIDEEGKEKALNTVNANEMIWGRLPNISPHTNRGLSPFEPNWDVVQATSNSFKAHGVLIKNMGANGLLVPESGEGAMPLIPKEQTFLQKSLDRLLGGAKNFGKAIISNASMKWISIGVDPNKLEILKMQEQSLKVLCSGLNLDSKLFNDASASTYNNLSEATKSAYTDCYIPYAETFFNFMASALLPDGVKWVVDRDRIDVLNTRDFNFEKETREGILSIQAQVSSGICSYESGIATLGYVYGIDEETASNLLDDREEVNTNENEEE